MVLAAAAVRHMLQSLELAPCTRPASGPAAVNAPQAASSATVAPLSTGLPLVGGLGPIAVPSAWPPIRGGGALVPLAAAAAAAGAMGMCCAAPSGGWWGRGCRLHRRPPCNLEGRLGTSHVTSLQTVATGGCSAPPMPLLLPPCGPPPAGGPPRAPAVAVASAWAPCPGPYIACAIARPLQCRLLEPRCQG